MGRREKLSEPDCFQDIVELHKIIIRHDSHPYFTLTVDIKDSDDTKLLSWVQEFDDEEVPKSDTHIVEPAN